VVNRKEIVIGASGVVLAIIALVAIVFVWTTVDNLGKKANDLEQRLTAIENTVGTLDDKVNDIEHRLTVAENTVENISDKVDDVEQRLAAIENKTWHTVGDFTLSPSKTSQAFHIDGKEWRLNFTFNQVIAGMVIGYNLRVYDASGNIVGGLSGIELMDIRDSGKGILNIREGQGDFTVEIRDMTAAFTFSFTVEEFY